MSHDASPFRYIFRLAFDPRSVTEAMVRDAAAFLHAARAEEVMLQIAPEELCTGYMTPDEVAAYREMAVMLKRVLGEAGGGGIALSLQPWYTTCGVTRGRTPKPGQDYRRMVGENGSTRTLTACPLDPWWREHLSGLFADWAAAVQPVAMWVEDDFRLHNHDPQFLGWGGCFCAEHLRRMSERVGEAVTRERLVATITAPGEPHPWRAAWLAESNETMLGALRHLDAAVAAVAPETRLALMTSDPDQHSVEGRDWAAFAEVLSRGGRFPVTLRPHITPYTEEPAVQQPPSVTRSTLACVPGPLAIYPELECGPRGHQYTKSHRFMSWQCDAAALYGSDGITLNYFDVTGNGVTDGEPLAAVLRGAKDRLTAIKAAGIDDRHAEGVAVLVRPEVAGRRRVETGRGVAIGVAGQPGSVGVTGGTLQALVNPSYVWARTLAILGVSHRFVTDPVGLPAEELLAVGAGTLWALDDAELDAVLARPLLLDALATEVVVRRGRGGSIGLASFGWAEQHEAVYSIEQVEPDHPEPAVAGRRMTAQRSAGRVAVFELDAHGRPLSRIRDVDGRWSTPGMVAYAHPGGGRGVLCAHPFDGGAGYPWYTGGGFFMAYFNPTRRRLLHHAVRTLSPRGRWCLAEERPLTVTRHRTPGGTVLGVTNPLLDDADAVTLRLPRGGARPRCRRAAGRPRAVGRSTDRCFRRCGQRLVADRRVAARPAVAGAPGSQSGLTVRGFSSGRMFG